jgi:hypothetical protein
MSANAPHTTALRNAITATAWWTSQAAPGDFANGVTSTAWTPVTTALTAVAGAAAPIQVRRESFAQVVGLLRQNLEQVRRTTALSPTQRQDSLAYGGLLLGAYERFVEPNSIVA